jgi:hypothetical protein
MHIITFFYKSFGYEIFCIFLGGPQGQGGKIICQMKALLYNIRGFGQQGHQTQLKDFMHEHRFDVLGLQETIKQAFFLASGKRALRLTSGARGLSLSVQFYSSAAIDLSGALC